MSEPPWKVLVVHEHYLEPGGEDQAFSADVELLRARGHPVVTLETDHRRLHQLPRWKAARWTLWNPEAHRRVAALVQLERPAVVHFHNTFPVLSPAVYSSAGGAAVVQTLHNFRLLCPGALLFHDGAPCEACLGRAYPWPGVLRGCYHGRAATAVTGGMVALHRLLGTWRSRVDAYVVLSGFARERFVAGGLPADRLFLRPNFLAEPPSGRGGHTGGYALYAGRLSEEKGVPALIAAWERLDGRIPLRVAGDGPLAGRLSGRRGIEWLGQLPREEVRRLMHDAALLVFPSVCYENFPLVLVEAFAAGLPVVAGDRGAAGELIERHRAGWRFAPGDPRALASAVERAMALPGERITRGAAGRAAFEREYTPERAYHRLMEIYRAARRRAGLTRGEPAAAAS